MKVTVALTRTPIVRALSLSQKKVVQLAATDHVAVHKLFLRRIYTNLEPPRRGILEPGPTLGAIR